MWDKIITSDKQVGEVGVFVCVTFQKGVNLQTANAGMNIWNHGNFFKEPYTGFIAISMW
jgi:dTDP-4-amino-4,6-dideoxygalactose transaminase